MSTSPAIVVAGETIPTESVVSSATISCEIKPVDSESSEVKGASQQVRDRWLCIRTFASTEHHRQQQEHSYTGKKIVAFGTLFGTFTLSIVGSLLGFTVGLIIYGVVSIRYDHCEGSLVYRKILMLSEEAGWKYAAVIWQAIPERDRYKFCDIVRPYMRLEWNEHLNSIQPYLVNSQ